MCCLKTHRGDRRRRYYVYLALVLRHLLDPSGILDLEHHMQTCFPSRLRKGRL